MQTLPDAYLLTYVYKNALIVFIWSQLTALIVFNLKTIRIFFCFDLTESKGEKFSEKKYFQIFQNRYF